MDEAPLTPRANRILTEQLAQTPIAAEHQNVVDAIEAVVRDNLQQITDGDQQYSVLASVLQRITQIAVEDFPDWHLADQEEDSASVDDGEGFLENDGEGDTEDDGEGDTEEDSSGDEDDSNAPSPRQTIVVKRGALESTRLIQLTMRPTDTTAIADLISQRDLFFETILRLRPEVTRGRQTHRKRFTTPEAHEITNLFFYEMMGMPALNRLNLLMTMYRRKGNDVCDAQVARRAHIISQDRHTSQGIRKLARVIEKLELASLPVQSVLASLIRSKLQLDLHTAYNNLIHLLERDDPATIDAFEAAGCLAGGRGIGRATLVLRYMDAQLQVRGNYLQNKLQQAEGLAQLVHHFGYGVLVLLPLGTARHFARWGSQRMLAVYPLLDTCAPWMRPICELLMTHVLAPIEAGRDLAMANVSVTAGDHTWLNRLQDAAIGLEHNVVEVQENVSGEDAQV